MLDPRQLDPDRIRVVLDHGEAVELVQHRINPSGD
jgi:hypothetical protein